MAVNVAEIDADATVTDAGTVRLTLFEASVTAAPPVVAALDRVTVQVEDALLPSDAGAHTRPLTTVGATSAIVAACDVPLYVAVTCADWSVARTPEVAEKVVAVDPDATVTDAGTVSLALFDERATAMPPTGAAWFRVCLLYTSPSPRD